MLSVVSSDAFNQLKDGGSHESLGPARPNFEPGRFSRQSSRNNKFEFNSSDYEPPREYYFKGKDEELSNFYPTRLKIFHRQFGSSEAAYQYCKAVFHNYLDVAEELVYARSGLAAKAISHNVPTKPEWHELKDEAMRVIIGAKIEQCLHFRRFLEAHPNTKFIENTDNEYWARGAYHNGRNMLGEILMQIRDEWKDENDGKEIGNKRMEEFLRKLEWPAPKKREEERDNWKGGGGYTRDRKQGDNWARERQRNDRQTDRAWRDRGEKKGRTDRPERGNYKDREGRDRDTQGRDRADHWNISKNENSDQTLDRRTDGDQCRGEGTENTYRQMEDDTKTERGSKDHQSPAAATHEDQLENPDNVTVDHWDFKETGQDDRNEAYNRSSIRFDKKEDSRPRRDTDGSLGRWDRNDEGPCQVKRDFKEATPRQTNSPASCDKTSATKAAKNKKKKEMKKKKKQNQQVESSGGGFEITEITFT